MNMITDTYYSYESDFATFTYEAGKECVFRLHDAVDFSKYENVKAWEWGMYQETKLLHNFHFVFDVKTNFMSVEGEIQEWGLLRENERIHRENDGWHGSITDFTIPDFLNHAKERLFIPQEMTRPWKESKFSKLFRMNEWACNYPEIIVVNGPFPWKSRKKYYREFIMQDTIRVIDLRKEKSK